MEGRKRTVQVKFYVTEEERRLIREKMKLIPTRNMAAYLRKMAIDGYVVHIDTTDIRAQTAELQKIGVNVNQIARRLNSMGPLYTQDVADIKGALAQIWQLQRYILGFHEPLALFKPKIPLLPANQAGEAVTFSAQA